MRLLFMILLLSINLQTFGGKGPQFTEEAIAAAEKMKEAIMAESEQLGPGHWAGYYHYRLDIMHAYEEHLWIAPETGYVLISSQHIWTNRRDYGTVEEKDGVITLHSAFKKTPQQENSDSIFRDHQIVPITWKGSRYLIYENRMVSFCNELNSGLGWPIRFYRRQGETHIEGDDLATFPEKYRGLVLESPINCRIEKIASYTPNEVLVQLDVGKKHGVVKDLKFSTYYPPLEFQTYRVKSVFEDHCTATIVSNRKPKNIEVGWLLTTGNTREARQEMYEFQISISD
jgi:hypothetical protein